MSALHLIFKHWFLSIVLVSVGTRGVARIILAFRGADIDKETP